MVAARNRRSSLFFYVPAVDVVYLTCTGCRRPEQAEFVRMAAKCGAVIVPFGAIGSEDSLQYVMDSQEVRGRPLEHAMLCAAGSC